MTKKILPPNPLHKIAAKFREAQAHHQARHQPSGFGFALADQVDFLNADAWDQVTRGGSVFLRRDVLRVIENHGPDNITPRYATIYRASQPVAVIAAQIVAVKGSHLQPEKEVEKRAERKATGRRDAAAGFLKRAFSPAVKAAADRVDERLLVAGNLMSWGFHGIAFAPGEDPAELWSGVAEALYRIRRAERLTGQTNLVMIKDVTAQETGLDALRRFSYSPLETEPNMVLDLPAAWRNYEDYLTALDAKYRRNARDQLKKLAAAGCVIEPLTDLAASSRRLHELYLAVHQNASVRLVTLPETYLPTLAGALGADFRCTIIRRGDKVLGFVTTLRDGPTAIAYYIGFDRAAAAEGLPIYLRLLHATVGDALALGCTRLSFGRTALEPKAALGAKPEMLSVWLRHRVPALNWALRGVLGAVTHAEAPERNPFRTAAG